MSKSAGQNCPEQFWTYEVRCEAVKTMDGFHQQRIKMAARWDALNQNNYLKSYTLYQHFYARLFDFLFSDEV